MNDVSRIIKYPKSIIRQRPVALKEEHRHLRADIPLSCDIEGISMIMFLRKLINIPENFTIGLRIDTPNPFMDSSIVLVRFQGPHGGQSQSFSINDLHNDFHMHEYSQSDFDRRRKRASNSRVKATFGSYEDALLEFLSYCCISDPYDIFRIERDLVNQLAFNFNHEES